MIFALLAAGGVFLAWNGLTMPRTVRLEKRKGRTVPALQARLDAAELPVTAVEFLTTCAILAAATAGVALVLGAPALALAGLLIAPAVLWQRYEARRDGFRQEYDQALAEVVQLLREGFSATGALRDALDHAVQNGPEPAAADFREVWRARATGQSLEESFAPVLERRRNPYLQMVAEALTLKASQGGSVGQVLTSLETMIREQVALRREIVAKQAQARLESSIICLAPMAFFVAMKILPWMRGYEAGFYSTGLGQIVLAGAVVFSALAFFLARKMATRGLNLEVEEVTQ